jgi:TetR/AcrR family transcriptional regulator, repressor for uid operon
MTETELVHAQDNRSLILQAARELFTSQGLHETTMADIARFAGVSRATVFNQFGSKALVMDAIAAGILRNYRVLVESALSSGDGVHERLLNLSAAMGKGIESDRAFFKVAFVEMTRASLGFDERGVSQELRRELNEKMLQLFLRGQVDKEITSKFDAEDMVMAFESQVFGTVSQWLQRESTEALETVMRRMCTILLQGIVECP